MAKLNPDLVSEMVWYECVFASAEQVTKFGCTWQCSCKNELVLVRTEKDADDQEVQLPNSEVAERFLNAGWGYTRTSEGFFAKCKDCRRTRRK